MNTKTMMLICVFAGVLVAGMPRLAFASADDIRNDYPALQVETESALKRGLGEFDAAEGWAIVMDAKTGEIYAMASCPGHSGTNRAITLNYEPGAVMMVITAAAALDSNPKKYDPEVRISTNRQDPNYYRLPGDGSHKWEPTISLTEAVCRSCNTVIGKV